uniref:Fibroblast growth factor binding protein 1b n=1 Tax=Myripristis murdjan TaxID=586833 RepID=A0A667Z6G9_9TELE
MLLLRTLAPWLLFAFLAQQVSLSSGAREKGRRGSAEDPRGAGQSAGSASPGKSHTEWSSSAPRGKFSVKDKMRCTWVARQDGEMVKVAVNCDRPEARVTGGVSSLSCTYVGSPKTCPGYSTNPAGFWKQVARAFKKLQAKVCIDARALVRAGMCKRAPREAHFKLDIFTSTGTSNGPIAGSSCTDRADRRKLAEEYCSSWASLCSFFFTMLESGDC